MMFSFFLSIYSQCGALASWASQCTTMCLDMFTKLCTKIKLAWYFKCTTVMLHHDDVMLHHDDVMLHHDDV